MALENLISQTDLIWSPLKQEWSTLGHLLLKGWSSAFVKSKPHLARDRTVEAGWPLAPSRGWDSPSGSQRRKPMLREVKPVPEVVQFHKKLYPSLPRPVALNYLCFKTHEHFVSDPWLFPSSPFFFNLFSFISMGIFLLYLPASHMHLKSGSPGALNLLFQNITHQPASRGVTYSISELTTPYSGHPCKYCTPETGPHLLPTPRREGPLLCCNPQNPVFFLSLPSTLPIQWFLAYNLKTHETNIILWAYFV